MYLYSPALCRIALAIAATNILVLRYCSARRAASAQRLLLERGKLGLVFDRHLAATGHRDEGAGGVRCAGNAQADRPLAADDDHALAAELERQGRRAYLVGCNMMHERVSSVDAWGKQLLQAIVRTTPPSTRSAVPVVPEACSEQT
jgi:hypothetical protein